MEMNKAVILTRINPFLSQDFFIIRVSVLFLHKIPQDHVQK